jgi:hypothetical protein
VYAVFSNFESRFDQLSIYIKQLIVQIDLI